MRELYRYKEAVMKEYDVEDYYLYWVATRDKPLVIGQKVSVGLLDGRTEKFGMIFRIKNRQDPESVKEILFFNRDRKICESLRIGGSASFDVVWEDGTITSLPER